MDSPSWQPCSGDGLEAGMLAEPGPMDEPTIAGATSGSRRLPDTPPPDALFTGNGIPRAWARGVRDEPVLSLLVGEGRCMASLGSSGHAKPKEMT